MKVLVPSMETLFLRWTWQMVVKFRTKSQCLVLARRRAIGVQPVPSPGQSPRRPEQQFWGAQGYQPEVSGYPGWPRHLPTPRTRRQLLTPCYCHDSDDQRKQDVHWRKPRDISTKPHGFPSSPWLPRHWALLQLQDQLDNSKAAET